MQHNVVKVSVYWWGETEGNWEGKIHTGKHTRGLWRKVRNEERMNPWRPSL